MNDSEGEVPTCEDFESQFFHFEETKNNWNQDSYGGFSPFSNFPQLPKTANKYSWNGKNFISIENRDECVVNDASELERMLFIELRNSQNENISSLDQNDDTFVPFDDRNRNNVKENEGIPPQIASESVSTYPKLPLEISTKKIISKKKGKKKVKKTRNRLILIQPDKKRKHITEKKKKKKKSNSKEKFRQKKEEKENKFETVDDYMKYFQEIKDQEEEENINMKEFINQKLQNSSKKKKTAKRRNKRIEQPLSIAESSGVFYPQKRDWYDKKEKTEDQLDHVTLAGLEDYKRREREEKLKHNDPENCILEKYNLLKLGYKLEASRIGHGLRKDVRERVKTIEHERVGKKKVNMFKKKDKRIRDGKIRREKEKILKGDSNVVLYKRNRREKMEKKHFKYQLEEGIRRNIV